MSLADRYFRAAAAVSAAALLILALACGGSGGSQDSATNEPPTGASAPASGSNVIDLANAGGLTAYSGGDPTDLVNVSRTLALGDFNDDGKTDALVGAPQADGPDNKRGDAGEAYVIFGPLDKSRDLGDGSPDVTILGAAAGDGLGFTVLAGDLNDDGVDDVLVGAPGVTAGFDPRSDQGRVYVFFGGSHFGDKRERDLSEDVYDFTVTGAEGFSRLGHSMDLGDVNDDGVQDLIVGAPFAGRKPGTAPGGERTALGEVYVLFGNKDLKGEKNVARDEYDVLLSGAIAYGQFGASVGVGDVNGDGRDDIVTGAYRASPGGQGTTPGLAYIFYGRSNFPKRMSVQTDDQDVTITGPAGSSFGFPIAVADLNGDEKADMAFGAQLESSGTLSSQGAVHVISGSGNLAKEINAADASATTITGSISGELFPSSLAAADIDGDGVDDLVTGSTLAGATDRPGAGRVDVIEKVGAAPGTIDLSQATQAIRVLGAKPDDRLGGAVAGGELLKGQRSLFLLAAQAKRDNGDQPVGIVYVVPVRD
ncbi:MAG TPA: hypothetical protein VLS25_00915 [Dehalococcoidia bacterium]|nr:hypothetical protein [Dehalococcoidia bacterium]